MHKGQLDCTGYINLLTRESEGSKIIIRTISISMEYSI